jgi:Fe-S oxidoreductase
MQTFEATLDARAQTMADACTRCGKCVEVCPVTEPGGISAEELKNPAAVIGGVVDIVRTGRGNEAARKWANACILSGECIKACDYGVNPRFLLHMARVKMARLAEPAVQRKNGVDGFRKVAREVTQLSRIQLDDATAGKAGAGVEKEPFTRRTARFRFLHRLQRAQDAAHRAACARHYGRPRRHL